MLTLSKAKTLVAVAVAGALALPVLVSSVSAQNDPIAERKAVMKSVGGAMRDPGQMMRGQAPFDLEKVKASLKTFAEASGKMGALYPAGSDKGGETTAAPKIWEAKADFDARFVKFGNDAKEAMTSITDEASFKANFPKVAQNCGGCHEVYRIEKK
jgi:cytochrome c556